MGRGHPAKESIFRNSRTLDRASAYSRCGNRSPARHTPRIGNPAKTHGSSRYTRSTVTLATLFGYSRKGPRKAQVARQGWKILGYPGVSFEEHCHPAGRSARYCERRHLANRILLCTGTVGTCAAKCIRSPMNAKGKEIRRPFITSPPSHRGDGPKDKRLVYSNSAPVCDRPEPASDNRRFTSAAGRSGTG